MDTKSKFEEHIVSEINENSILLTKQSDGNWKGWMWKFGKTITARQSDPIIVLQLLLTHPGTPDEKTSA